MIQAFSLRRLEHRVRLALDAFTGEYRAVTFLERELAEFVAYYLAYLGMDSTVTDTEAVDGEGEPIPFVSLPSLTAADATEVRQLYRQVARQCHPDSGQTEGETGNILFRAAVEAFECRDLCALHRLEWEAFLAVRSRLAETEQCAFLERKCTVLMKKATKLAERRRELIEHPAARLRRWVERGHARGLDLLAELRLARDYGLPLRQESVAGAFV